METRSPPKDIWEQSAIQRRSDGLRIFMAKTKKGGSPSRLTPFLPVIPFGYYKQVLGMIALLPQQQVQISSTFGFVGGILILT